MSHSTIHRRGPFSIGYVEKIERAFADRVSLAILSISDMHKSGLDGHDYVQGWKDAVAASARIARKICEDEHA